MTKTEKEAGGKTAADVREEWIKDAVLILGSGKGHMGIIIFLRSKGLAPDQARKVSFDIFDEARRRVWRGQMGYRLLAWTLIALGFLLPVVCFIITSGGLVFVAATPLILGGILLGKQLKPSRLPEN